MFKPTAKNKELTFKTVRELCATFQTSLTATAIRLVELGSFPAIVVCSSKEGRKWFVRGPDVPEVLWLKETPGAYTDAYDILRGCKSVGEVDVQADGWITHPDSHRYSIREDSVKINSELVLSLLWWKDESQLLDLSEDE
jgi:hypothetical protein